MKSFSTKTQKRRKGKKLIDADAPQVNIESRQKFHQFRKGKLGSQLINFDGF